jgi:hypothetical protein
MMLGKFARKVFSLDDLKEIVTFGASNEPYIVAEEIEIGQKEWAEWTADFFEDKTAWFKGKGGIKKTELGVVRECVLIRNADSGEELLVDPQGYDYARYVGVACQEA